MDKTASKLDWLKERKDFNTNPQARAATRILDHLYAPHGDDLYPWILREIKRGNIQLPPSYPTGWLKLIEMEMAAERELARRQAVVDHPDFNWNTEFNPAWDGSTYPEPDPEIDWNDIENAPWNKLTDYLDSWKRPVGQHSNLWEALHQGVGNGGQSWLRWDRPRNDGTGIDSTAIHPDEVKQWGLTLADRAKRRKGVDPMQFSAPEFIHRMDNEWGPEYDDQVRGNNGEVVHAYPDKWTIRRLRDAQECEQEGEDMGHCVGQSYYGDRVENGNTHIFSLRDPRNRPHATIEIQPDSWRNRGVPREMFERHGVEEPPQGYSSYVDSIDHMLTHQLYDPHYQGLQQRTSPDETASKLWRIAEELRAQREQAGPSWHGGKLTQVFGKEDSEPIEPYKQRVRDWFGAIPQEAQPTNLESTAYHPDAIPSYWQNQAGGIPGPWEQGGEHLANVHYPGATHKSRVHGGPCHCPWGGEQTWSWNEHTSAIEWEDVPARPVGQRGGRERLLEGRRRGLGGAWDLPAADGREPEQPSGRGDGQGAPREDRPALGRGAGAAVRGRAPAHEGVLGGVRRRAAYASLQQLLAAYDPVMTTFGDETPTEVRLIYMERLQGAEPGVGAHFAQDVKAYCDQTGKRLVVDHNGFLGQQGGFMAPTRLEDGSVGWAYDPTGDQSVTSKVAGMDAYAEMVPIDAISHLREWDRRPGAPASGASPEYWEALKKHVAQNGFENPLSLEYNPWQGKGYLGEGNHRLAVAQELGMTHVPVFVYRTTKDDVRMKEIHPPGTYLMPDAYGHSQFGQYMKPSDIGLPTGAEPYTPPGTQDWYDTRANIGQGRVGRQATCPTCGDPLQGEHGTFCPRCSWSEDNPNIDSDPLSNPPDPTVDMHRGIQARIAPSHRWAKWLSAVEDLD